MAVQTPVIPVVSPAGAPTYAAVGASDTIPVAPTGKYLILLKGGAGADTAVVVDPTTQNPPGAVTPGVFNLSHSVPATPSDRHFFVEAQRFRDVNGNIVVTHSASTGVTCLVYGPF